MPVCLRFANAEIKSEYLKWLQFRGREQSKRQKGNNFLRAEISVNLSVTTLGCFPTSRLHDIQLMRSTYMYVVVKYSDYNLYYDRTVLLIFPATCGDVEEMQEYNKSTLPPRLLTIIHVFQFCCFTFLGEHGHTVCQVHLFAVHDVLQSCC